MNSFATLKFSSRLHNMDGEYNADKEQTNEKKNRNSMKLFLYLEFSEFSSTKRVVFWVEGI